jgi:hypothetical protein
MVTKKSNKVFQESDIQNFFYESIESYGFIHAYKELNVEGLRIDIFAIDKKHDPFIIEFKKKKDRHIVGQSAQYLAVLPSYKDEIAKKINFFQINWEKLSVLLVAPSFNDRDFQAATYQPLKNRIHFFKVIIKRDYRKEKIFGLRLTYEGPDKSCPIRLPEYDTDYFDVAELSKKLNLLEGKENKREFYTVHILPILEKVATHLKDKFSKQFLYPHISYFGYKDPFYMIRVGTDEKSSHRASIGIFFCGDNIEYGFDLTHSLKEGKYLSKKINDDNVLSNLIKNLSGLEDYSIWVPNTGIFSAIWLDNFNEKGLSVYLKAYQPVTAKDCYFRVVKEYEGGAISIDKIIEIIIKQYQIFKFFFDLIKVT